MDVGTVLAAVTGSVTARVVCFPIDTLTVRRQTLSAEQRAQQGRLPLRAYYRGLPAALLFVTPGMAAYLSAYRWCKDYVRPYTGDGTLLNYSISAVFSEVTSSVLWTPMEVIKARSQIARSSDRGGALGTVKTVWREEGLRGFYRGYLVGLVVYIPYASGWWLVYENLKNYLANHPAAMGNTVLATALTPFVSSGVATFIAGGLSAPVELVKTRYQVANSPEIRSASQYPHNVTIRGIVQDLYKTGGWRAFTRGLGYRLCYMVPGSMISMATFEFLKPDIQWAAADETRDASQPVIAD